MYAPSPANRMRQYQQQAIATATPAQLTAKVYDIAVAACHAGDRKKVRRALVELTASLDFERGGEVAQRLDAIYEYCLHESAIGDLSVVGEILAGIRDAWNEGVVNNPQAQAA